MENDPLTTISRRQLFRALLGSFFVPTYYVTSLADSGPGTFRHAMRSGARHIMFDVTGEIKLNSGIKAIAPVHIDGSASPHQVKIISHGPWYESLHLRDNSMISHMWLECRLECR